MNIKKDRYSRTLIEVSGVDDLVNDPHVRVTIYRGIDRLLTDATGDQVMPGGSQRIDVRWGAEFMQQLDGEIVNGVLTTKPVERMLIPWDSDTHTPTEQLIRDMRLQLKLSPTGAQGFDRRLRRCRDLLQVAHPVGLDAPSEQRPDRRALTL